MVCGACAALVPELVERLTGLGYDVAVEVGAGLGTLIADEDFEAAGARTLAVASSWATEARRSNCASRPARVASMRACRRSSRPAVQLR